MKRVLTILFVLSFIKISAQEFNKEVTTENGRQLLVGQINLEGLQTEPYASWFSKVDSTTTKQTKP